MPPKIPLEVLAKFEVSITAERQRRDKYGDVRPVLHIDFQDYKFVAVGSTLFYNKNWKTFPDFLFAYVKHALGSGWGQNELAKPLAGRHPIMKWYDHVCRMQQEHARLEANGLYSMVADGITSAYMHLAYDLYVLRDKGKLQKVVLERGAGEPAKSRGDSRAWSH